MPRKATLKARAETAARGGYIDIELDADERAECLVWVNTENVLGNALQQVVDEKYQVKLSYDAGNECYVCYISGHWKLNKPDADWTLVGRGSTVDRSLGQALYKHFEVLKGDWSEHKSNRQREVNWD